MSEHFAKINHEDGSFSYDFSFENGRVFYESNKIKTSSDCLLFLAHMSEKSWFTKEMFCPISRQMNEHIRSISDEV